MDKRIRIPASAVSVVLALDQHNKPFNPPTDASVGVFLHHLQNSDRGGIKQGEGKGWNCDSGDRRGGQEDRARQDFPRDERREVGLGGVLLVD